MKTLENIEALEKGNKIVVFSDDWCGDCIAFWQISDSIIAKYPSWEFVYASRDEFLELAKFYNVFGIPSFVALIDGVQVGSLISKDSKGFLEICEFIDKL